MNGCLFEAAVFNLKKEHEGQEGVTKNQRGKG
jgi:hypothetical protein